ncbi:hypothetical protein [Kocuria sabuli]|uniref:hypothetical protein n=1 Tax=Kocuria sabuli TaxID=3071448 RepID=UPI0034D447E6
MGNSASKDNADAGSLHRTMRNVSIALGLGTMALFGLFTAVFGLRESDALVLFALFLLGVLPPNMFLHFIAQRAEPQQTI